MLAPHYRSEDRAPAAGAHVQARRRKQERERRRRPLAGNSQAGVARARGARWRAWPRARARPHPLRPRRPAWRVRRAPARGRGRGWRAGSEHVLLGGDLARPPQEPGESAAHGKRDALAPVGAEGVGPRDPVEDSAIRGGARPAVAHVEQVCGASDAHAVAAHAVHVAAIKGEATAEATTQVDDEDA